MDERSVWIFNEFNAILNRNLLIQCFIEWTSTAHLFEWSANFE